LNPKPRIAADTEELLAAADTEELLAAVEPTAVSPLADFANHQPRRPADPAKLDGWRELPAVYVPDSAKPVTRFRVTGFAL
jgi:hypothetical protein